MSMTKAVKRPGTPKWKPDDLVRELIEWVGELVDAKPMSKYRVECGMGWVNYMEAAGKGDEYTLEQRILTCRCFKEITYRAFDDEFHIQLREVRG